MAMKAIATPEARAAARRVCAAQADARAVALAPIVGEIRASGIAGAYVIAAALTARGIPTARGHRFWMTGPVRKILNRLDRLAAGEKGVATAPAPAAAALPTIPFPRRRNAALVKRAGVGWAGTADLTPSVVTELVPLGTFATWQAERAIGDHDRNSLRLRLDPQGNRSDLSRA
jgi:hypothetical protein